MCVRTFRGLLSFSFVRCTLVETLGYELLILATGIACAMVYIGTVSFLSINPLYSKDFSPEGRSYSKLFGYNFFYLCFVRICSMHVTIMYQICFCYVVLQLDSRSVCIIVVFQFLELFNHCDLVHYVHIALFTAL